MAGFTIRFMAEEQTASPVCLICNDEIFWSELRYYYKNMAVCGGACKRDMERILTALGIEHEFVEGS